MILMNKEITKVEVKKMCQSILNNSNINKWLEKEDSKFLNELIKCHNNYVQKKGCGIKGFKIQLGRFNQKYFELHRLDDSYTDFSYLKCLNNRGFESEIKSACRYSIEKDILKFKRKTFDKGDVICDVSKEKLFFDNCHVDHHKPSFKEIFNLWIKDKNITKKDLSTSKAKDNEERITFINKSLEDDFREFHNRHCNLRIVLPEVNLNKEKLENDS